MDALETQITAFLAAKRIAVVGLSSHERDFSCAVLDKLEQTGAEVYGVNPKLDEEPTARRYRSLQDIPVPIDAVFMATAPAVTEQVVKTCHELGIGRVWMHQGVGQGSTSPEAIAFCKAHGIAVIDRGCPMMFVQPVDWFHRMFRWCKGMHAVPQPETDGRGPTAGS